MSKIEKTKEKEMHPSVVKFLDNYSKAKVDFHKEPEHDGYVKDRNDWDSPAMQYKSTLYKKKEAKKKVKKSGDLDETVDLIKANAFPIGTVHTFADGRQYRKDERNRWNPIGEGHGENTGHVYDYTIVAEHEEGLKSGDRVQARWTAGSGGHFQGDATVKQINRKSIVVTLNHDVGGGTFPVGHKLTLPKTHGGKWAWFNGVFHPRD